MARAWAAGVLILVFLVPGVAAQVPDSPLNDQDPERNALDFAVICPQAFIHVPYNGQGEVNCVVRDLSRDSVFIPDQPGGTSVSPHTVQMQAVVPENATGWQVIVTRPFISMYGGDVVDFSVNVKATPLIAERELRFTLEAVYTGPNGYTINQTLPFLAQVQQYDFALVSMRNQAQKAGQDEVVTYQVEVANTGVYPDLYRFSVTGDRDMRISTPPNLYVPAGETRTANISVLTPRDKVYELGRSTAITIKIDSVTGTGVYSTTGVLNIRGPYVPAYWIPLTLVGLISGGVVVEKTRERAERRRLEKGAPRRVRPTPRQAAMLAALKKRDPAAYKEKKAKLDAVYQQRREEYRATRRDVARADRLEAKRARREFKADKKQRKAAAKLERKEAKARRKVERREAKAQRKIDRKEAKVTAKKRKALEKRKKKLGKKAEKARKKQAKLDAKQAKIDARVAKKEARAQAKAEKAAKRAAKKKDRDGKA